MSSVVEKTEGFEILPLPIEPVQWLPMTAKVVTVPPVKMSIKEFAERHKVDYLVAQGLIKFLEAKGLAFKVGTKKTSLSGKGKPTNVYEIPASCELKLVA